LKHPRTPPTNPSVDYPSGDSDHISKRTRPIGMSDEVICYSIYGNIMHDRGIQAHASFYLSFFCFWSCFILCREIYLLMFCRRRFRVMVMARLLIHLMTCQRQSCEL